MTLDGTTSADPAPSPGPHDLKIFLSSDGKEKTARILKIKKEWAGLAAKKLVIAPYFGNL